MPTIAIVDGVRIAIHLKDHLPPHLHAIFGDAEAQMTFDVGFSGELDFTEMIATGPIFAPLRDEAYFQTVAVQEHGRSFGWNLDEPGHEIDLCPDATRIRLETQVVEELARRWRARRSAAE